MIIERRKSYFIIMTCHIADIGREVRAETPKCGPRQRNSDWREGACRDRHIPPRPCFLCQMFVVRASLPVSSHRQIGDHNTGSARALDPDLQSHCSKTTAALPHCSSNLRTTGEHHLVHLLFDALLIRADRLVGELPSSSVVSDHSLSWKYDRFER